LNNNPFGRLFDDYHEFDHKIHRIETGVENTSDEYLKKKKHLNLRDELFQMIQKA